jgi:hypothetical protein
MEEAIAKIEKDANELARRTSITEKKHKELQAMRRLVALMKTIRITRKTAKTIAMLSPYSVSQAGFSDRMLEL